jgi:hypothetical protein
MSFTEYSSEISRDDAQERRAKLLPMVLDSVKQVVENENGFSLRFPSTTRDLRILCDWLVVERMCNSFLRLQLSVESKEGPIRVELSGPTGTKDFLISEFGLQRWL